MIFGGLRFKHHFKLAYKTINMKQIMMPSSLQLPQYGFNNKIWNKANTLVLII